MSGMTGFGPPPGTPAESARQRPPSYLPPGGLSHPSAGMPGAPLPSPVAPPEGGLLAPGASLAPGGGAGPTAYSAARSGRPGRTFGPPLMTSSHKPGIIPLRPMALGDLLDGAVKHSRRNPGPVLGLTLLVLGVGVVPAVLLSGVALAGNWYAALDLGAVLSTSEFSLVLLGLGILFATLVVTGMLAQPVAEATLGHRLDLGQIWTAVRPRLLRLVGLQAVVILLVAIPTALVVLALVLLRNGSGLLLFVLAAFGLVVLVVWNSLVIARTVLAGPALVLERKTIRASFRRAWALSRGSFWRVGGTTVLVTTLAGVVFLAIDLPLTLVLSLLSLPFNLSATTEQAATSLAINIATLVSSAVVVPVIGGAICLVYLDQRMRKEGFDLVLLRAASSRPGAVR
ncbi:hypothetical protein [Lapillicoccus sp.]|uniref:hypothetical protein n=1 Tax=Lapillicoccus sp. TaxID=1909287 RepID=UPI0025D9E97E|nr:hypothetical protein [Lapillicoccus sp.]